MVDSQNKHNQIRQPNSPSFFDDNDEDDHEKNSRKFDFIDIDSTNPKHKQPYQLSKNPYHLHHFKLKNLSKPYDTTIQGLFGLYKGYIAYFNKVNSKLEIMSYLCIDLAILSPKMADMIENKYYFMITKNQVTYEFVTSDEYVVDDWLSSMKLICIHYNFHEEYKAIKLIGKGSFARVYRAENNLTKVQYAVKACSKEYLVHSTKNFAKATIINEICILRQLKHENIMKLYQVYETINSLYMITELINGKTLEEILSKSPKFDEIRYKRILKQILEALSYLSSKSIMHRDLKPDNILIDEADNAKIIDFGLSASTTSKELIFDRCGTPGYIAPEIFSCDAKKKKTHYDERCDVFSAGCIFYYMLFGCKYMPGKKASEILQANKEYKTSSANYQNILIEYHSGKSKFNRDALHLLLKMIEIDPFKRISASMALEHPYFGVNPLSQIIKKSFSENDMQIMYHLGMKSPKANNNTNNNNNNNNTNTTNPNPNLNLENPKSPANANLKCSKSPEKSNHENIDILDTFKLTYNTNNTPLNESKERTNSSNRSSNNTLHKNKPSLYLSIGSHLMNGGPPGINTINSEQLSGSISESRDTPLNKKNSLTKLTITKGLYNNTPTNDSCESSPSNSGRIKKIYKYNNLGGVKAVLLKNIQKNFDLVKAENNTCNPEIIPNLGFSDFLGPVNKFTIEEEDSENINTPSPVTTTGSPNKLKQIKSKYTKYKYE